ncbi:MAG: hypothetical protein K2O67_06440, partial [Clostridia bacterium]|nr:hypothetical protein [Clostridia bacterium]
NLCLGIVYGSAWNISICVYYFLLVCIRAFILFTERRLYKKGLNDEEVELKRKSLYLTESVMLFFVDFILIAPISLMVLQRGSAKYTTIPAIACAAYTVYKTVIAVINFIKAKRNNHISVKMLKTVCFIDALVSVLTLQYTLITTFGDGVEGDMLTLCAISSFAVWVMIIAVSVISIVSAVKLKKEK